ISGHENQWIPEHLSTKLLDALNSMNSLKCLKFELRHFLKQPMRRLPNEQGRNQAFPFIELPLLKRLERFKFYSNDHPACLVDSLRRYAQPNEQLKQIALANQKVAYFLPEF